MNKKRIVFQERNVAELCDYEVELPQKGEVQVRLNISTISNGTERANLIGETNVSIYERSNEAKFPRIVGYSSSGVIEAVGDDVIDFKPGDKVALSWSTHSEVLNISQKNVYKIEESISDTDAALFHIATFPLAAVRKCHVEIGESAMVMGMGILGLISLSLLRLAGAAPIIAVDPIDEKRKKALLHGADYALDPYEPDFAEKVKKLTNGGVNVAIEVTGVGNALDSALDCIKKMGRIALLGCTRKSDFTIDYYHKVHGPGISLIGAHTLARPKEESSFGLWTQRDDMMTLIKLTQMGRLHLGDLVDEVHTPENASEVFNRLVEEKLFPIVQFDWRMLNETNKSSTNRYRT